MGVLSKLLFFISFQTTVTGLFKAYISINCGSATQWIIENETSIFNNFIFNNSNEEKIPGITIDNKLTFKGHIKISCRKAAQKMGALSRLLNHLSDSQKRLIFNSLIKSQFNYCPLMWMFCSRTSNNMINKIHERLILN